VGSASNENYESSVYVTIAKGSSSANYSLYVPEGSGYIVSYSILPLFGEYVQKGYNNASVTTANKDSATKYNVTKNLSGINLTLLPLDRAISGTVSLPDGTASVGYTIHVPANKRGSGYQLEYRLFRAMKAVHTRRKDTLALPELRLTRQRHQLSM